MRRTSFPRARFSGTTSVKASSAFSASFRLRPERAAIWWTSSPLPTMFSVHGKDKACSLPFRCFARCCAHEAMLHNRAGLCQGSLSPAGYVPAWHVGAGSAQRHLLAARRAPQVPLPSTRAVLATQLGTSVVKVGILSTIEQASLPKKVRYEHNQRGPCCSYSLATCLASRRGSISTWCLHLTQAPSMFPHRDIHSGRLTASRI